MKRKNNEENHWILVSKEELDIKDEVQKLLDYFKKLSYLKGDNEQFALEVDDKADELFWKILSSLRKKYQDEEIGLDDLSYPLSDRRSIPWGLFRRLRRANVESLCYEELSIFEEFLNTPPGKELEAWEKWNQYWEERRKT